MSWTLEVYSPTATLLSTVTEATSPNPIMGSVEAVVDAGGVTNSITARARQDLLEAPTRGLLRYAVDGTAVAAGVIVTSPPTTSPGSGPADRDADALDRITAVGLEQLARESIIGPRLFEGDTDVADIALELCSLYAHPALVVDAANFPATGFQLGLFYKPEATLADVLEQLCQTVPGGARWYVNTSRELILTTA